MLDSLGLVASELRKRVSSLLWREVRPKRRPDGSTGTYEHITVDDAVRIVAINASSQVCLVADDWYLQGRRILHLPGGGSGGQEPQEAALRELEEETGLVASSVRPLGIIDPLPAVTAARTHLFLATDLRTGTIHRDDTEMGVALRLGSAELPVW